MRTLLPLLVVVACLSCASSALAETVTPSEGGRYPIGTEFTGPCSGTFTDTPAPPWHPGQRFVSSDLTSSTFHGEPRGAGDVQPRDCVPRGIGGDPTILATDAGPWEMEVHHSTDTLVWDEDGHWSRDCVDLPKIPDEWKCAWNVNQWWPTLSQDSYVVHFSIYDPNEGRDDNEDPGDHRPRPPKRKKKLKADAGGPYKVTRGGRVKLDGSGSTPRKAIRSYKWTFAADGAAPEPSPQPPTIPGPPPAMKTNGQAAASAQGGAGACSNADAVRRGGKKGIKATATILCRVKVTLTVSDGKDTATDTATVNVKKRNWQRLQVKHRSDAQKLAGQPLSASGNSCAACVFGRNVCAAGKKGTPTPNDRIIQSPDCTLPGFDVGRVKDAGGPFDESWYVASQELVIDRVGLVNEKLFPRSALYRENAARGRTADLDLLRRSVIAHERFHTDLYREALAQLPAGQEPIQRLEALVEPNHERISALSNDVITRTEELLTDATADRNVVEKMKPRYEQGVTVRFNDGAGGFEDIHFDSLAAIGD